MPQNPPHSPKQVRVDLGCGPSKVDPAFLGVDRFALPGVDVIADMDEKIPLESNSVDLLYASHSLEHCKNIMHTMQEIYRICRHGAQVCIVSPYYATQLNLTNPYHFHYFNEHTPRFWSTRHHKSLIPYEEWNFANAFSWPLGSSDHSDPGIDFHCIRMEFFYFPKYHGLPESELRSLRKNSIDVCDQIVYHLLVIKESLDKEEMDKLAGSVQLFDPPPVSARRARESCLKGKFRIAPGVHHVSGLPQVQCLETSQEVSIVTNLESSDTSALELRIQELIRQLSESDQMRSELQQELGRVNGHYGSRLNVLAVEQSQLTAIITDLRAEIERLQTENKRIQSENEQALANHKQALAVNKRLQENYSAAQVEASQAREQLQQKLTVVEARAATIPPLMDQWALERTRHNEQMSNAQDVEKELREAIEDLQKKIQRNSKLLAAAAHVSVEDTSRASRIIERARGMRCVWDSLPKSYQRLKDDSIFLGNKRPGWGLRSSVDLRTVPYLSYPIDTQGRRISSVQVALVTVAVPAGGHFGIELISPDKRICVHATAPLDTIEPDVPFVVTFPTVLTDRNPGWEVRLFAKDLTFQVYVLEFRRHTKLGFGHTATLPFCAFGMES